MISMYHKDGVTIGMTHYCAIGNQPHMKYKGTEGKSMSFEVKSPEGIGSMKNAHMHSIKLTMPDENTLIQEWSFFEKGSKKGTSVFTLKRKI